MEREIERLRNEFIDAQAQTWACPTDEDWEKASIARYKAAHALVEALKESNIDVTTDAKQDPTDIEIAIDFGKDGVTYIHPLQGAWTPVYRFDEQGLH